jgi:hypothetical protein
MQFLSGPSLYRQGSLYLIIMFINLSYLFHSQEMDIETLFMNLLLTYRCSVIAAKYGSMP